MMADSYANFGINDRFEATFSEVIEIKPSGTKSVSYTENGNYTEDVEKFGEVAVSVNVPNSYTSEDEGKVVNDGALVEQTSKAITANGTYDTTTNNEVSVNVPNPSTGTIQITSNGTHDVTEYAEAEVAVEPQSAPWNDVCFYDYDGTILYSYSQEEFAELTEMPPNPAHSGLVSQGWNWDFEDAQEYVAEYGELDIGQMYITDDGKTRLYVTMYENRNMTIYIACTVVGGVIIDWGDGTTTPTTATGYTSYNHEYASEGDYIISLEAVNGRWWSASDFNYNTIFGTNSNDPRYEKRHSLTKVEVGNGAYLQLGALRYCARVKTITLPDGFTLSTQGTFQFVSNLRYITIPKANNQVLYNVCFNSNSALTAMPIPKNTDVRQGIFESGPVRRINFGAMANTEIHNATFKNCHTLPKVVIPEWITKINYQAFYICRMLTKIYMKPATPPTLTSTENFYQLPSTCVIYVPKGTLEAYQNATNWSVFASQMQEEE